LPTVSARRTRRGSLSASLTGNEEIYWYPYDMILDGDTGAVEYVPVI
jgi:hypothetical protein